MRSKLQERLIEDHAKISMQSVLILNLNQHVAYKTDIQVTDIHHKIGLLENTCKVDVMLYVLYHCFITFGFRCESPLTLKNIDFCSFGLNRLTCEIMLTLTLTFISALVFIPM